MTLARDAFYRVCGLMAFSLVMLKDERAEGLLAMCTGLFVALAPWARPAPAAGALRRPAQAPESRP